MSFLIGYVSGLFARTPPPAYSAYGFRWQAGTPVPAQLSSYDLNGPVAPGLYVAFPPTSMDAMLDPFGRLPGGVGTVFPMPGAPTPAMANLVAQMRQNPPPGQAALFNNVTIQRQADLSSFLAYTNSCLEIINATAAGTALLQRITTGASSVFVTPGNGGNQTFAADGNYVTRLTEIVTNFDTGSPIPGQEIVAMVNVRYPGINGLGARFNQLAADVNALPMISLFVDQANFEATFLYTHFRYRQNRLTGANLLSWTSPGGFADFNRFLHSYANQYRNVLVRQFFLLALNVVLCPSSPPGAGTGAGVKFNVRNEGDNVLGSLTFRPPCVGLAHELMHAMHYGRGTAAGADFGHFTTTSAELLFVGITPFAAEPISENQIRGQYAGVPPPFIDPSNVWAVPALRTTYEPPTPPATAASLRTQFHCI
jgi:hypothetical protein